MKVSNAELRALSFFRDDRATGDAESWADYSFDYNDNLAWYRHQRILTALEKKGLTKDGKITLLGIGVCLRQGG